MDAYLDSVGLWRKPTAKDGSCLFRAVAEQVGLRQLRYSRIEWMNVCLSFKYSINRANNLRKVSSLSVAEKFNDIVSELSKPVAGMDHRM